MTNVSNIAGELRSLIEEIERLETEKREVATNIKEVYTQAKKVGLDTTIMRELVKQRRMDKDDLDERDALLDTYKRALGMLSDTPLGEAALRAAAE